MIVADHNGVMREVLVSPEDEERLRGMRWYVDHHGYCVRNKRRNGRWVKYGVAHEVLGVERTHRAVVDHVNGDKLDNRRENLRVCTQQENTWNRGPSKHGKSGLKGVTCVKSIGKWKAQATSRDGRRIYLGCFGTKEEAARAYNSYAKSEYGEFAWLNPVEENEA